MSICACGQIGQFLGWFCTEKLRFSVVCCGLRFFFFSASGFQFLAKRQVVFFHLLYDVVFCFSNFFVCMTRLRGNSKLITFIFHGKGHIKFLCAVTNL